MAKRKARTAVASLGRQKSYRVPWHLTIRGVATIKASSKEEAEALFDAHLEKFADLDNTVSDGIQITQ